MKTFKLLAASLALICGQAFATPYVWTDTITPVPPQLVNASSPAIFSFDITDGLNGFRPGIDTVSSYSVAINLFDDSNDSWLTPLEVALVNMPGVLGNVLFGNLSGVEYGNESVAGFWQLDNFGLLTVGIYSMPTIFFYTGDFMFGGATLTASGNRVEAPAQSEVPEPGSLLLLGAALTAATFAGRRRKQ